MIRTLFYRLKQRWVPATLTGKGRLFVVLLLAYVALAALYLFGQKADLVAEFERYNSLSRAESALVTGGLAISDAYNDLFFIIEDLSREDIIAKVHKNFQSLQAHYTEIALYFPDQAGRFRDMAGILAATVNVPSSDNLTLLRAVLTENKAAIDQLVESNLALRTVTVEQLIARSNSLAFNALLLSIAGIIGAGMVISIFFTVMASHLKQLSLQLQQILSKQIPPPMEIKRRDELGDVMRFSQEMGTRLEQRDAELAIERQRRIHQERRAAIDHLLGGLLHELGNPIAAVSALTQNSMHDTHSPDRAQWLMLSSYVDRMTEVLSDLNRLNLTSNNALQQINLNEELDRVLKLFKYDERWQQIVVEQHLASDLRPAQGNPATLQQLLTILLNFGIETLLGQPKARLGIQTLVVDDHPVFQMASNIGFSEQAQRLINSDQVQWSDTSETEFDLVMSRYLAESAGCKLELITQGGTQTLRLHCTSQSDTLTRPTA